MKSLLQRNLAIPLASLILLSVLATHTFVAPLRADELIDVRNIEECRAIKAKAERLLCYDTIIDGGIFNEQQLLQVQVENFGSTEKQADISVDRVIVSIERIQKETNGFRYFYTSDGQVWKQKNMERWNSKPPFEAEIKSGILGSFFLVAVGTSHSVRVKRVR